MRFKHKNTTKLWTYILIQHIFIFHFFQIKKSWLTIVWDIFKRTTTMIKSSQHQASLK